MWRICFVLFYWIGWFMIASSPAQASPAISSITDNRSNYPNSQIPKYSKLEITFQVTTSATNLQLPYDPNPPNGIFPATYPLHQGISVDAVFTSPGGVEFKQPAFYYYYYDNNSGNLKPSWDGGNYSWKYPTGQGAWKVRFSPNQWGDWQFRLTATDASGTIQTTNQPFTVSESTNHGFLKVSPTDPRYFEFDDGTLFNVYGIQGGVDSSNPNSVASFQKYAQSGITLMRNWISGLYGTAWQEWWGAPGHTDGYLPRTGTEAFHDPVTGRDQLTLAMRSYNPTGWYDPCRFHFYSSDAEPVKPNKNYHLQVKYWGGTGVDAIAGPANSQYPTDYGLVAKITTNWLSDNHDNCYESTSKQYNVTSYGKANNAWETLQATWNSGTSGKYSSSLSFDGTNDYVEIADNANLDLNLTQISIAFWVKLTTATTWKKMLAKSYSNGTNASYLIALDGSSPPKLSVALSFETGGCDITSDSGFPTGIWTHIIGTWDGTNIKMYLNGIQQTKVCIASKAHIRDTASNLVFGQSTDFLNPMTGQLDDVRIYNYALTDQQVKLLYNNNSAVSF